MTKTGKCDTCRQRKIRCSEGKPCCDQCRISGRPCRYTLMFGRVSRSGFVNLHLTDQGQQATAHTDADATPLRHRDEGSSSAATLQLRKSRGAESGGGVFQSFRAERSRREPSTIPREPCGPETRLVLRWGHLVAPNGRTDSPLNCFGHNISMIPEFFGRSETVHAASVSLMDALTAYMDRSSYSRRLSYRSYGKALETLRDSLDNEPDSRDALAATSMLVISTLSLGPSTFDWAVHVEGQYRLLNIVSNNGSRWNDIISSVFYSCYQVSVVRALDMAAGRDSVFDTPTWLKFPPPSDSWFRGVSGAGVAQQTVMAAMVRVPRLWRLVQRNRLHPEDQEARTAATELAATLFSLKLEFWVDELFQTGVLSVLSDNLDTPASQTSQFSFKFPSVRMLCLLFDYWQSRILVCGCIQTLGALPSTTDYPLPLDLREVENADVLAATNIIACSRQMTELGTTSPIARLRWSPATMNAFSAWARLEKRERIKMLEDVDAHVGHEALAEDAAKMQRFCCELMARWINFWKPKMDDADMQSFYAAMQSHADFMGGGDVPPLLKQFAPSRPEESGISDEFV